MRVDEGQYLAHYGVLGMKWGTRKAVNNRASVKNARKKSKAANAQYNRDFNNAYNKAGQAYSLSKKKRQENVDSWGKTYDSAKAANKANKAYAKAKSDAAFKELSKKYPGNSKTLNKRLAKMSTGKALAQSFLLGSYGALKYNEYKSKGWSTGKSVANAVIRNFGNNLTLGSMARKDKKRAQGKLK